MTELLRRHLHGEAVLLGARAADAAAVIDLLGTRLEALGHVRPSWSGAARERERAMPTGLPLGAINVAIPHTDIEHVVSPAVALAVMREPVRFASMEDPDEPVDVHVVFALAIRDKNGQIAMLQAIMEAISDPERLRRLAGAATPEDALAALAD